MTIKIGINGFGRIGRMVFRAAIQNFNDIEVVGINDLLEPDYLAYMLKFDSVHGRFRGKINVANGHLKTNGHDVAVLSEATPEKLPWRDLFRYRTIWGMMLGFFCLNFIIYFFLTCFFFFNRRMVYPSSGCKF